jgi:hypothetical protein
MEKKELQKLKGTSELIDAHQLSHQNVVAAGL